MVAEHKFLKVILPAKAFAAVRAGTREWLIECPCGHKRDLWDVGGVRYKAVGEPRQYHKCPKCGQGRWHKIRKKTEAEKQEIEVQGGLRTTMKTCPSCNNNMHNDMKGCPFCGFITAKSAKRQTSEDKVNASMPIYTSSARMVSKKRCYRIYTNRVELDCPHFFKKTFVIHSWEIIDVWVNTGTTLKDVSRLGGILAAWRCLKLDLADAFRHVVLKSHRVGYFKSFAFVPEKPDEFVNKVQKMLLSSAENG